MAPLVASFNHIPTLSSFCEILIRISFEKVLTGRELSQARDFMGAYLGDLGPVSVLLSLSLFHFGVCPLSGRAVSFTASFVSAHR